MPLARKSFSVVYRSGGTHRCTWTRILDSFDETGAKARAAEIELGGRKALVFETSSLDAIGLPVGWEPKLVDWQADHIELRGSFQTFHEKAVV